MNLHTRSLSLLFFALLPIACVYSQSLEYTSQATADHFNAITKRWKLFYSKTPSKQPTTISEDARQEAKDLLNDFQQYFNQFFSAINHLDALPKNLSQDEFKNVSNQQQGIFQSQSGTSKSSTEDLTAFKKRVTAAMSLAKKIKLNVQKLASNKVYSSNWIKLKKQINQDLKALASKLHQPY